MELQKNQDQQLQSLQNQRPLSIERLKDVLNRNYLGTANQFKSSYQSTHSQILIILLLDEEENNKQLDQSQKKQQLKTQTIFDKQAFQHQQPRQVPQNRDIQTQPSSNKNDKNASKNEDYQSTLLSRFLKEPRIPPSSNIVNKRKSFAPVNKSLKTGINRLNQTTNNGDNENNNRAKKPANVNTQKKSSQKPVISYRNQSEIMKKIFGNEQHYNQVKSLFRRPEDNYMSNNPVQEAQKIQPHQQNQQYDKNNTSQYRAQSTPHHQHNKLEDQNANSQNNTNLKQLKPLNSPKLIKNVDNIYQDKVILAKSREKLESIDHNRMQTQPLPAVNTGADQVEKAIFDLQDVKNNYFQEKSMYDQKIQQIQIKQQNSTIYGNSFLQGVQKTQSSFFGQTNRPMTSGNLFKNHQLINDENILKSDLEKVSKEDLRERLVVAELVMKKLFQRNKDLEDQIQTTKEEQNSPSKIQTISNETPLKTQTKDDNDSQLNKSQISKKQDHSLIKENSTTKDDADETENNCMQCITLRKELVEKENEAQLKLNELQLQLINKASSSKNDNHLQYLKLRLDETMNEAKRHFTNYIQVRNSFNSFLESRLNQNQIQGGTKGQKIQNDILSMLKKNLEQQEHIFTDESQQFKRSLQRIEGTIDRKDQIIIKKDKKIKVLNEEIERRQFLESKVQKYVRGLIAQNQKCNEFIESLLSTSYNKKQIEDFLREIKNKDFDENEGESTENEGDEQGEDDIENGSLEINDL
ncbi:UNKNOWN [Stylonychia lemnae]|uniref:Uncharacterized protein n=1 Tax=Stylonychia lemnae TaxID=5949 RepID=A0A078AV19_STYLE|nr:UNKNOWN [Stylonychia lemnae]|eukprot:CDW85846.1 UNKNOWN [Stylonychia lemnae]